MARRRSDRSTWYILPEDLNREVLASKEQGFMTEKLAEYVISIHNKVTAMPRFKNYPMEVKEEIISWSLHKFIKNESWKRLDPEKGSTFAYITTAAFRNMLTALGIYFRQWNMRVKLIRESIEELRKYFAGLHYTPTGWEEACEQLERELNGQSSKEDEEDV